MSAQPQYPPRPPRVRVRQGRGQTAHTAEAWLLGWRIQNGNPQARVRYRWRELPWETLREWVEQSQVVPVTGEDYRNVPVSHLSWDAGTRRWIRSETAGTEAEWP
jgi:hypothetical protein